MRNFTRRIAITILAAAAGAGCHRAEDNPPVKVPTPVRARVVAGPHERGATRYSATVEPAAKVDLSFKVGGYVREVAHAKGLARKLQEGDWVTKGTVLALVND